MTELETAEREEVYRKNKEALLALVGQYDLYIRREDFDNWRPTVRTTGDIPGVKDGLTIIATDGLLAYFLPSDEFDVFFGHIQLFTEEVKPLFSMPKERSIKEKRPRKIKETMLERAIRLLSAAA